MKWAEIHEHNHSMINHILRTVGGKHKWLCIPTVSTHTMKKSKDFHVIGYLGNYTTDAACDQVVINSSLSLKILPMKPKWSISHRYIYVGNHEYVGVPHYTWLILVPIVTAAGICFAPNSGLPSALKDIANGIPFSSVDNGDDAPISNDSISFYGYTEQYVSSDKNTIALGNPSNNDVYFEYVISDSDGNVLYKSDLIKPGEAVAWAAADTLETGDNTVTFQINTYDMTDTTKSYNGMQYNDVVVHVYA